MTGLLLNDRIERINDMALFHAIYNILWGDLITIPLPGGSTLGLSLLVLILVPAGIYFTIRTKFLPFRLFPEMLKVTLENNRKIEEEEREESPVYRR